MVKPTLPVDVYVRVSRVGGRERLISPDEQERRARQLARERGLRVGVMLTDLDESGGRLDRPGLQEGLRRVEARESGGIIVAWLDRLSRDSEHALGLVRRIQEAGGAIYAPDAPSDWTTPEGELQGAIFFAFATYVRQRARAGFERAKEQAIARGIPVHVHPPVGYRQRDDRRLEPDPRTAPVVREVFERRAERAGLSQLARLLETRGVKTGTGAETWLPASVMHLLRNRIYLGELRYGRDARFFNPAAHEPLVDVVTWERAQAQRTRAPLNPSREPWLLTGLIRCHTCSYALKSTWARERRVYRCGRRHAGGVCPSPAYIDAETIEQAALADFWTHTPNLRAEAEPIESRDGELVRELERAEADLAEWAAPEIQRAIGDLDTYAAGLVERRQRVAAATAALEDERRAAGMAGFIPLASTLREAWEDFDTAERRELLALRYDCFALRRDGRLTVFPAGTAPSDLPRRGGSKLRAPSIRSFPDNPPSGARVVTLKQPQKAARKRSVVSAQG